MSQDIKSSTKQAHLHAVSKPARTSTIRGSDPNAKSRVLDPGTSAAEAPTEPAPSAEVTVSFMLVRLTYEALRAWATQHGMTVEEILIRHALDIEQAIRVANLGEVPSEPPAEGA